jgi:hypothetical protein
VLDRDHPLVVFSLMEHENKMSVLNFKVKMRPDQTEPIKSKEELVFYTGLRHFTAGHMRTSNHFRSLFWGRDVGRACIVMPALVPCVCVWKAVHLSCQSAARRPCARHPLEETRRLEHFEHLF